MRITRLRCHTLASPPSAHLNVGTALTIGNFDGVHLGHQAMLMRLRQVAQDNAWRTAVMTFEPHPRDYFATITQKPQLSPARILSLRDKLCQLQQLHVDQCALLKFDQHTANLSAEQFIEDLLVKQLQLRYLLIGDDFRFGAQRRGDFKMLQQASQHWGFKLEQLSGVIIDGQRVSSSLVRQALERGDLQQATRWTGRPYGVTGHVVHGRKLGRQLGFSTLNLRFQHWKPACSGIFAVLVHGLLPDCALQGVANIGVRPSLDANDVNGGRVLVETHVLNWPADFGPEHGYGKLIRVELLHKLHDERRYDSLAALTTGIQQDCNDARAFFLANHANTLRQTTRDRI